MKRSNLIEVSEQGAVPGPHRLGARAAGLQAPRAAELQLK